MKLKYFFGIIFYSYLLIYSVNITTLKIYSVPKLQTKKISNEEKTSQAIRKFEQGQDLHSEGKFEQALIYYDESLKFDELSYAVHFQRGMALLSLNRITEALSAFNRSIELKPDFAPGFVVIGQTYIKLNKLFEAEKALTHALELEPNLLKARISLAQILINKNAINETLKLLEFAKQQSPSEPEFYAIYAEANRLNGNLPIALQNFDEAIKRNPNNGSFLHGRAKVYSEQKNYQKALVDLLTCYSAEPNFELAFEIIELYELSGNNIEGLHFASNALEKNENNHKLRGLYASLLIENKKSAEALEQYLLLAKQEPENPEWWFKIGELTKSTNPEKAMSAYEQVLLINPRLVDAKIQISEILLQSSHFDEAAAKFQEILLVDPDNYNAHAGIAMALFKLDKFQLSIFHFEWMIKHRPDISVSYFFLGICFDKLKNYIKAVEYYEKFLTLADSNINNLEIEKVKLRLPNIKRLIKK